MSLPQCPSYLIGWHLIGVIALLNGKSEYQLVRIVEKIKG
jgi:hypothetical protein